MQRNGWLSREMSGIAGLTGLTALQGIRVYRDWQGTAVAVVANFPCEVCLQAAQTGLTGWSVGWMLNVLPPFWTLHGDSDTSTEK